MSNLTIVVIIVLVSMIAGLETLWERRDKTYISWKDFEKMRKKLVKQIKKSNKKFDGVYGIPRGGLILAVCLSHDLNLPLLKIPTKNSLIAEDISDTGNTLIKLIKNKNYKKIACLYSSNWTKVIPDYYVKVKVKKFKWLVFPYENQNTEERK